MRWLLALALSLVAAGPARAQAREWNVWVLTRDARVPLVRLEPRGPVWVSWAGPDGRWITPCGAQAVSGDRCSRVEPSSSPGRYTWIVAESVGDGYVTGELDLASDDVAVEIVVGAGSVLQITIDGLPPSGLVLEPAPWDSRRQELLLRNGSSIGFDIHPVVHGALDAQTERWVGPRGVWEPYGVAIDHFGATRVELRSGEVIPVRALQPHYPGMYRVVVALGTHQILGGRDFSVRRRWLLEAPFTH